MVSRFCGTRRVGMGRGFISAISCVLLLSGKAAAGWYHVENYEGSIGSRPVHISLQTYDGFGSGITVEGSYFYDAKQSPMAVFGKLNGTRLALCEISNDKEFAVLCSKSTNQFGWTSPLPTRRG
jgi:hypothetical protein